MIVSVAVFVLWIKVFYWFRLFTGLSFYMRLIKETIYDLRYILIILITILLMFSMVIYAFVQGQPKDKKILPDFAINNQLIGAFLDQYLLGLGEYSEVENFDAVTWIFFLLATFITQITIVNMLIAVMGDTFDKVNERKNQAELQEKIKILADYVWIV